MSPLVWLLAAGLTGALLIAAVFVQLFRWNVRG
jgi:hypothetical protein